MAKDTEKLIRQLSLISFLMAQGRPVSALEIKREVEGYSDMNSINKTINDVNRQVQREIKQSLRASKQQGDADKLIRCIQRAHQNVNRIQRCSERFQ